MNQKYQFSQHSIFGAQKDLIFMKEALCEAKKAFDQQEVPIGAIVVDQNGVIVGRGHNQVFAQKSQHAHAEILAIADAGKTIGDWRLNDCWIYVTLEPCVMCMGLITLSRCAGVLFGPVSPLFGFQLDNDMKHSVYNKNAPIIIQSVATEESLRLLQLFFKTQRKKRDKDEN